MKFFFLIALMISITLSSSQGYSACVTKEAAMCEDGSIAPQDPVTCKWLACPTKGSASSAVDRIKQAVRDHNNPDASSKDRICTQNKMMTMCADGSMQAQDPVTCKMIPCGGQTSEKACPENRNFAYCPDGSMQMMDQKTCKMVPCSAKKADKVCSLDKMLALCPDGSSQPQDPKTCALLPCGKNKKTAAMYGAMNDLGIVACEGKVCSGTISNLECKSASVGSSASSCSYENAAGETKTVRGSQAQKLFSEAKQVGTIAVNCAKGTCTSTKTTLSCSQRGASSAASGFQECSATPTKELEEFSNMPDDRNPPSTSDMVR